MTKPIFAALMVAGALLLGGCSEEERREFRQHKERIAAETARQARLGVQYAADVAAETQRIKDKLVAETQRLADTLAAQTSRERSRELVGLGKIAVLIAGIVGWFVWVVYSFRRLGETHLTERTKRHEMTLKVIEASPHLKPEQRGELLRKAIEANGKSAPLIGYTAGGGA